MSTTSKLVIVLTALPALARADGTAEPAPPPTDMAAPAPVLDAGELRRGFHVGFSVGGAYLPTNGGISALVGRLDLNYGRGWIEHRLSPIAYRATNNDEQTLGLGAVYQEYFSVGSRFSFGGGVLLAFESKEDGSTTAYGFAASPATIRLGNRRNYELGLNAVWIVEPGINASNAGAYIAFSYLSL